MYGDYSIHSNDYITMVQGLPDLKKRLSTTDPHLIAICTDEYL